MGRPTVVGVGSSLASGKTNTTTYISTIPCVNDATNKKSSNNIMNSSTSIASDSASGTNGSSTPLNGGSSSSNNTSNNALGGYFKKTFKKKLLKARNPRAAELESYEHIKNPNQISTHVNPLSAEASVLMHMIHKCDWAFVREHLTTKRGSSEFQRVLDYDETTDKSRNLNLTSSSSMMMTDDIDGSIHSTLKDPDEKRIPQPMKSKYYNKNNNKKSGSSSSSSKKSGEYVSPGTTTNWNAVKTNKPQLRSASSAAAGAEQYVSPSTSTGHSNIRLFKSSKSKRSNSTTVGGENNGSGSIDGSYHTSSIGVDDEEDSSSTSLHLSSSVTSFPTSTTGEGGGGGGGDNEASAQAFATAGTTATTTSSSSSYQRKRSQSLSCSSTKLYVPNSESNRSVGSGNSTTGSNSKIGGGRRRGSTRIKIKTISSIPTLLHLLCTLNPPVQMVQRVLSEKPSFSNSLNNLEQTPLHISCIYNASPQVIQCLLKHNKRLAQYVDHRGKTPLHLLCEVGIRHEQEERSAAAMANRGGGGSGGYSSNEDNDDDDDDDDDDVYYDEYNEEDTPIKECMDFLLWAYPDATLIVDCDNKIPLDYAVAVKAHPKWILQLQKIQKSRLEYNNSTTSGSDTGQEHMEG